MKIKKGVNPINTIQLLRLQHDGKFSWFRYRVYAVTGDATNAPNQDGPTIFMELADKHAGYPQQYMTQPLSFFSDAQRVLPESGADRFWKEEKSDVEIQSEEV